VNWDDTIGQYIHAKMVEKALQNKPDADLAKLHDSIKRTSLSVGIARTAIADVIQAELESLAMLRVLGTNDITNDFLAGMVCAERLIRTGKHVTGE
jgi:hypothetical protein